MCVFKMKEMESGKKKDNGYLIDIDECILMNGTAAARRLR